MDNHNRETIDDRIEQYKARRRYDFSQVSFLTTDQLLPRETCGLRRSTLDQASIAPARNKSRKDDQSRPGLDRTVDRPATLSDKTLVRDMLEGRRKRLFITGEGGLGKTEFTRYLAWELSKTSSPVVPLLFELQQWKITGDIYQLAAASDADLLTPLAQVGRVAFIFDGLDELRFNFNDFSLEIQQLINRFPECKFVLAGRPGSLGDLYRHGFSKEAQHLLEPLGSRQINRYIQGYFETVGEARLGQDLISTIRSSSFGLSQLLGQPFMLSMTCQIHQGGKHRIGDLLDDPSELVEQGLRLLFARRREDVTGRLTGRLELDEEACLSSLSCLAAHSFEHSYEINRQKAIQILQQYTDTTSPGIAEFRLASLAPDCGVLIRTHERNYRFTNRVIAEFLAARWIVSHGLFDTPHAGPLQPGEDRIDWSVLRFLSDNIWSVRHRDLWYGVSLESARRKPELLMRFIRWLVETLRLRIKGGTDDMDLKRTLVVRLCHTLRAFRVASHAVTVVGRFQMDLFQIISPNKMVTFDKLTLECLSLLPSGFREPYFEYLINQLRVAKDRNVHWENIEGLATTLASGFAGEPKVCEALIQALHGWDPDQHLSACRGLAYALASGFSDRTDACEALLTAFRTCRNAKSDSLALIVISIALANGFSDQPGVCELLVETLRDCHDLSVHSRAIFALAQTLPHCYFGRSDVGAAFLDVLRACRDPELHHYAIEEVAKALVPSFSDLPHVRETLLNTLRFCSDPCKHGHTIGILATTLASGYPQQSDVCDALVEALRKCQDPDKDCAAICFVARALGSGFAGQPEVDVVLIEALQICTNPKTDYHHQIRELSVALARGSVDRLGVRQALIDALQAYAKFKDRPMEIELISIALASGFAEQRAACEALLEIFRECKDLKEHRFVIDGLARALASGFSRQPDVRGVLIKGLQACHDPKDHSYAIWGFSQALASGFPSQREARVALVEALRFCRNPKEHRRAIEHLTDALASGFSDHSESREAILEVLRICNPNEHGHLIGSLARTLASKFNEKAESRIALVEAMRASPKDSGFLAKDCASAFAGDAEVARAIFRLGNTEVFQTPEWEEFVLLKGARDWLTGWAGEHGEKWGLAADPAFTIKDLDDKRPDGGIDEEWANREAVLVAPREKIRNGLDPRLLPTEHFDQPTNSPSREAVITRQKNSDVVPASSGFPEQTISQSALVQMTDDEIRKLALPPGRDARSKTLILHFLYRATDIGLSARGLEDVFAHNLKEGCLMQEDWIGRVKIKVLLCSLERENLVICKAKKGKTAAWVHIKYKNLIGPADANDSSSE